MLFLCRKDTIYKVEMDLYCQTDFFILLKRIIYDKRLIY